MDFALLCLFPELLSHVLHGLHKGSNVAIQVEHIVFKCFDMLVRGLAESKGNTYLLRDGDKGNVFL